MNSKEATRRIRQLQKESDSVDLLRKSIAGDLRTVTEEYFGLKVGDEAVYIGPDPSRFTAGVVVEVRSGYRYGKTVYMGTIVIQPWNKNGHGSLLTRDSNLRRYFTKKGLLRHVRRHSDLKKIKRTPRK